MQQLWWQWYNTTTSSWGQEQEPRSELVRNMTVPGTASQWPQPCSSSSPHQWAWSPPGQPHSLRASLPGVQKDKLKIPINRINLISLNRSDTKWLGEQPNVYLAAKRKRPASSVDAKMLYSCSKMQIKNLVKINISALYSHRTMNDRGSSVWRGGHGHPALLGRNTHDNATLKTQTHGHYLGRGNTVDKADLLEAFLAHGEADLPAIVDHLVDHHQGLACLIHLVLQVHVHVATETYNLEYKSRGLLSKLCLHKIKPALQVTKQYKWFNFRTCFRLNAPLFSTSMII